MRDRETADDERKERGKKREVRNERRVHEHGDPRLQIAVAHHHARDPVQRPGEIDDARQQAERERAPRRRVGERDEQRRERDPRERRMAVFREAEREENARGGRECVLERARGHSRSVYHADQRAE